MKPAPRRMLWKSLVAVLALVAGVQFSLEAYFAPQVLRSGLPWDSLFKGRIDSRRGPVQFVVESVPDTSPLLDAGVVTGDVLRWDRPMRRWISTPGGEAFSVDVVHGDATRAISIRALASASVSPGRLIEYLIDDVLRLVALLIGTFIAWRRAELVAFRAFAAAALLAATAFPHSVPATSHIASLDFIASVAHDLWPVALVLFAINYPDDRSIGLRRVLRQLYPWLLGLQVVVVVLFNARLYEGWFEPALDSALKSLLIVSAVVFFLGIVLGWRDASGSSRTRFNWIVATLGTLVVTSMLEPALSIAGAHGAIPGLGLVAATIQLIAISALMYAILRHQIFNFGLVVNRTLVFTIVGALLLGAIQIGNGIVGSFLHFEDSRKAILLSAILAVVVSLASTRMKVVVERFVERTFFGSWARKEDELKRFVERASYVTDTTVLQVQLLAALDSFAGSGGSVLFQFIDGCYQRTAGSLEAPRSFAIDHPAVLAMRAGHTVEGMPVDCLPSGVALPLPMAQRGHLHGFVMLGRKNDGDTYRPDQIAAMHRAAHAVGEDLHALSIAALKLDLANERTRCATLQSQLADDYTEDCLFHPLRGFVRGEA